jgi:nitroreductase
MVKVKVFDSTEATRRPRVPESAPTVDAAAFHAVVQSRRSVRIYTDEPVPEDVVRRCIDAALLAPNSSNLQVWEIHWVRSPEQRAKLVEACLGQPAAATAKELFVFVARPDRWRANNERMIAHLASQPGTPEKAIQYFRSITPLVYTQGPWSVLRPFKWLYTRVRGLRQPTPREPIHAGDMAIWAHKNTALACAHFMLAMRAEGFDTCPMEGLDSARVKQMLGLPASAGITMAISAGKRAQGGVYGPRFRFPTDAHVFEH